MIFAPLHLLGHFRCRVEAQPRLDADHQQVEGVRQVRKISFCRVDRRYQSPICGR